MRLVHEDFHWKRLILDHAGPVPDRPLAASVTVIQPQGYRQELTVSPDRIQLRDGAIELALLYPMIDDGRYDPSHGTWNGAWEMGSYRFSSRSQPAAARWLPTPWRSTRATSSRVTTAT